MAQPDKRPTGRPVQDLAERLTRLVGRPLDFTNWPDLNQPCWSGPQRVSLHGEAMATVRALFHLVLDVDEMHPTWRTQRACQNRNCINPHHHSISLVNRRTGVPIEPLPQKGCAQYAVHEARPADREADIEAVIDYRGISDRTMALSPQEVHDAMLTDKDYPMDIIEEAFSRGV